MPARRRHSTRAPAAGRAPTGGSARGHDRDPARAGAGADARAPALSPAPASASAPTTAGAEAREVEWQLTAPDLGLVRRWLEQHTHLDDLILEPLPAQQLHDIYLETEDWRLMRAGFALRLREKEGHVEATLKGLRSARDDAADRREITETLAGASTKRSSTKRSGGEGPGTKALAHAIGPVGTRVRDVAGVRPLRTLFEVRTSRQRFAVRKRRPAADVGEIALDEARFSRGDGHRRPMLLTRVEVEASGPDSTSIERLAQRLRAECGLHRAAENKFAVGLRSASLEPPRDARPDRGPEPAPPPMDAAIGVGDFAAATLQRLLREWQANEPGARLGEGPEPLHKLRVAGRRMDTVLNLFRAFLPPGLARSRPTLKSLVDALGDVRDVDVRIEAVNTFRSRLLENERPTLDPLLEHLEAERARKRATMLRALDSKRGREWLDTLPGQLARTASPKSPAPSRNPTALTAVPDLIRKRYKKLRKFARRLTPESSIAEFHKVRVRTKKLRYALEVVAPTYAKPAEEMLETLHKLQSKLGTQHDSDVAARYLTQLAARPPANFSGATLFLMGRMAELHAREAARMGGKVGKSWRGVRGSWKKLHARTEELRDETSAARNMDGRAHKGIRGTGRLAGTDGRPASLEPGGP